MKHFNYRKLLPWVLLAGLGMFGFYRIKLSPKPAVLHTVLAGEVCGEVMGTGLLNTHYKAAVSPKVFQGRLVEVLVDQNDFVTNGQLLARLDDSEQRRQVETARAAFDAAAATARRVREDEKRAQAVLKLAQLNYQREAELLPTRSTSQADFDQATEAVQAAKSGLAVAQAAIVEADRQQLAAEKQLAYQKELLADTLIPAPFNGLVVKRNHDPGDVVAPGASIVDLVDTNEIWVSAWVDETAMAPLQTNQTARVVFRSEPGKAYLGRVVRLGRETDPESREFVVDVLVRELPAQWTVGQRAEVYIETGRVTNAPVLPARFLLWRQGGQPGVLVNDHGRARWRDVKVGLRGRQTVEVRQGLTAGDTVCISPEGKPPLAEGQRVANFKPRAPHSPL